MIKSTYRLLMVVMVASLGLMSWGCGTTIQTNDSSLLSASSLDSQPVDPSASQVTEDVEVETPAVQVAEQSVTPDISDSMDDATDTDTATDTHTPHHSPAAHSNNNDPAANQAAPPHCP